MNAEIIQFLTELRQNNNREWFQANKSRYDSLRKGFIDEVQQLIDRIALFDPEIAGLEAKDCLFRIYRDIRFSPTRLRIRFILQPIWLPVGDEAASVQAIIFILNRVAACFRVVFGVRRLPC